MTNEQRSKGHEAFSQVHAHVDTCPPRAVTRRLSWGKKREEIQNRLPLSDRRKKKRRRDKSSTNYSQSFQKECFGFQSFRAFTHHNTHSHHLTHTHTHKHNESLQVHTQDTHPGHEISNMSRRPLSCTNWGKLHRRRWHKWTSCLLILLLPCRYSVRCRCYILAMLLAVHLFWDQHWERELVVPRGRHAGSR